MKTVPISEAKKKLSGLIDIVRSTNTEVVITKHSFPAAVLMSHDKFESLKETSAICSDTALMREIKEGLRDLKRKKAKLYTLEELFD